MVNLKLLLFTADLPEVPKSPPSSYALFVKDYFNREKGNLQSREGGIKIAEISHGIAEEWKVMSSTDRAKYENESKKLRTAYEIEFKDFMSGLTPAGRLAIQAVTGKTLRLPKSRPGLDGGMARNGKKKPLSAFFEFLAEMREKGGIEMGDVELKDKAKTFAKRGGDMWKALSAEEKQVRRRSAFRYKELGC